MARQENGSEDDRIASKGWSHTARVIALRLGTAWARRVQRAQERPPETKGVALRASGLVGAAAIAGKLLGWW